MRNRKVDNHRLAGGLAYLAQTANDKRDDQRAEPGRKHNRDREKREAYEGRDDKRFAADAIGQPRRGYVNQNRRHQLDSYKNPVLRHADADHIGHIDYDQHVGQAFAHPDDDIGDQQPFERGVKAMPHPSDVSRLSGHNRDVDGQDYQNGDRRKDNRYD